ncbi:hypothetical protein FV185_03790 [Ferrovum sp. PN-J185]|nr:hypothetical protein FV185_03790 [Ferrovum sp. PN-J185]
MAGGVHGDLFATVVLHVDGFNRLPDVAIKNVPAFTVLSLFPDHGYYLFNQLKIVIVADSDVAVFPVGAVICVFGVFNF